MSGFIALHWFTLPASLSTGESSETSAVVSIVRGKGGSQLQMRTEDFAMVQVNCVDAPALCCPGQFKAGQKVQLQLRWVGAFREAWIVAANIEGTSIADPASQDLVYQRSKAVLGWVSIIAAALAAFLVWAGPFRSAQDLPPSSTFWS